MPGPSGFERQNLICRGMSKWMQTLAVRGFAMAKVLASTVAGWYRGPAVRRKYSATIELKGTKLFGFVDYYPLFGDRLVPFYQDYKVLGTKQRRFKKDIPYEIAGIRSFRLVEEIEFSGTKSIPLTESVDVEGKKDLTPILVALDLL